MGKHVCTINEDGFCGKIYEAFDITCETCQHRGMLSDDNPEENDPKVVYIVCPQCGHKSYLK